MSLFSTFLRLAVNNPNKTITEDFLTELFSYCLQVESDLLQKFLTFISNKEAIPNIEDVEHFYLETQVHYKALEHHEGEGSKPDMVVTSEQHIIFIENKVDSSEGANQLPRYADHLNNADDSKIRTLIYITRDYDPKEKGYVFQNFKDDKKRFPFIQLQWYEVFLFFKKNKDHPIIQELLIFFKEQKMATNNQFNPVDIITLNNFSRVKIMMDKALKGDASKRFETLAGGISQDNMSMTQLRDKDRYIVLKYKNNKIWMGLGFWLNSFNEEEYPTVGFVIEVAPSSDERNEIVKIFRTIADADDSWHAYGLKNPKVWSNISIKKSMRQFLSEDDHIEKIKEHFMDCLEKYAAVKYQLKDYL